MLGTHETIIHSRVAQRQAIRVDYVLAVALCALLVSNPLSAQLECGTPDLPDPHFDQKAFSKFSEQYRHQMWGSITMIPVVAHIARTDYGEGGLNPHLVEQILADVNEVFAGSNLQFFYCMPSQFIDDDLLYNYRTDSVYRLTSYNIPNVVNLYITNTIFNGSNSDCGRATYPWAALRFAVVSQACATNGSTVAHEFGHYFGLRHTHSTTHGAELVDRSNCLFAGDKLCDTPADPRLGTHNVNSDCRYFGNDVDVNNHFYRPDPRNIMSYSRKSCRNRFSRGQTERMAFYADRDLDHLNCSIVSTNTSSTLDRWFIYPNPTSDEIHLSLNDLFSSTSTQVQILNMQGQLLAEQVLKDLTVRQSLPVKDLPVGLYAVVLRQEGMVSTQRFFKN